MPTPPDRANGHYARRRPRHPSQWDLRSNSYANTMSTSGASMGTSIAQRGYIPGPHDIVRAPAPGETGPLAGINVEALRAILDPRGVMQKEVKEGSEVVVQRHARRLYVGNIPVDTSDMQLEEFFNRALIASKGVEMEGNPIVSVYMNLEKRFAFIETRTVREAAAGLMLDGVKFREVSLRLRRPNDYTGGVEDVQPPEGFNPAVLGIVSTQVGDGPNKVFIGGIPYNLTEDQIKSLLQSYGPLSAFNLIKEPNTGMSKGFAFFEFMDPNVVDAACQGLHGMQVGDKTLTVRRATAAGTVTSTRVVELSNVVSKEEVEDEDEFKEIVEDMEEEGRKFGHLQQVIIPRSSAQVGKVYLKYAAREEAERAHAALGGRKFGDRVVEAAYYDERKFEQQIAPLSSL